MLKINKNMLILLVKINNGKYVFLTRLYLTTKAVLNHNIRFITGPATAIKANCAGVPDPVIETNAGTNIIKGA